MKFKTLLIINSVMALFTGIACVLAPAQLLSTYGIKMAPIGLIIYQLWGTALIGLGMLTWFVRNTKDSEIQKAFALSLLITNGISCVIAIRGQFVGANSLGWSTVALFFLLALGFGSFQLINTRVS